MRKNTGWVAYSKNGEEAKERMTRIKGKRENRQREEMQTKCRRDKHLPERGIIMQPFSRVIIGLQAVRFLTE